jgi:hypothetical protein
MADDVKPSREFTDRSVLAAVRLPDALKDRATQHAKAEDITFSQLMRRALRREIERLPPPVEAK